MALSRDNSRHRQNGEQPDGNAIRHLHSFARSPYQK